MNNFITGNKVIIKSKFLTVNGCEGNIVRWHHDDVYSVVILDRGIHCGKTVTVRASEMVKKETR